MTQYNDVADIPIVMETEKFYANDDTAFGRINIGQYLAMDNFNDGGYGFFTSNYYASPTPLIFGGTDISTVMFHEIGHSLGIGAPTNTFSQTIGDTTYYMGSFKNFDEKTFTRADGQQISGIPINLWENNEPAFAHSELEKGVMSHQRYRSYANFTEAELAMMQDMGYDIDRRNFYGRSIYNDGVTLTNTQGFSKRENGEAVTTKI